MKPKQFIRYTWKLDKKQAKQIQEQLKNDPNYPVQHVHIEKQEGRLKYLIKIGGKNSRFW